MLDINFIRQNQSLVEKSAHEKGYHDVNISELLSLDDERRSLIKAIDALRQKRNELSSQMKGGKPNPELIAEVKKIKAELSEVEPRLNELEQTLNSQIKRVPNIIFDDVPSAGKNVALRLPSGAKTGLPASTTSIMRPSAAGSI